MENINIERFNQEVSKYVDSGVFSEVFDKDGIIAYNVLNQYYLMFDNEVLKRNSQHQVGIIMNSYGLQKVYDDKNYIYFYSENLSPDMKKRMVAELNDEYLKKLITAKPKYDIMGPSKNVDLELEKRLQQKVL